MNSVDYCRKCDHWHITYTDTQGIERCIVCNEPVVTLPLVHTEGTQH